jgi:renalase
MDKVKNFAIIGAGIAGLSCATTLQNAGFDVSLFEKSRGVSGRLSTRRTEGWQCDHGAQYFTARDQRFHAEVQRWVKADIARLWQPRLMTFDGTDFSRKFSDTARFVGYPSNNMPAKWLAESLCVKTEMTVTNIEQINQQWQITSNEQGVYQTLFDAVVLAIPAPQAAVLLKDCVPTLYEVAATINMQACFALMFNIEPSLGCDFDGLFVNNSLLSWVARDSAKPGRQFFSSEQAQSSQYETWILHATSEWSEVHIQEDKAYIAEQMLAEFKRLIARYGVHFPPVIHQTLHRWLYAQCEDYLTASYLFDQDKKIGVCGDWLNGGKVQGAWLSGLQLAQQFI